MLTRRMFLRGSAIVMAGMGPVPSWLARAASLEGKKRKILVAIFQRGAADGLNIVVPFAEKRYRELRPTLAIAPPSGLIGANGPNVNPINGNAIDLDGRFALNGAMQPLKALWDKKQLAIVEATGSPIPRARISMRRITWNRARPARPWEMDGSIERCLRTARKSPRCGRSLWGTRWRARFAGSMKRSPWAIPSSSIWVTRTPSPPSWKICTPLRPTRSGGAPARTRSTP